jgi:hypothetical protein
VIGVRGSVIDVAFPDGKLPAINEALEIEWDRPWRLTVEVQSHLDPGSVRTVARCRIPAGFAGARRYAAPAGRCACRSATRCSGGS